MKMRLYIFILLQVVLLASCVPQEEEAVPKILDSPQAVESDADLMKVWRSIPQETLEATNVSRAVEIAGQLSATGPEGLEPIFDELASDKNGPIPKIVATISLGPHVNQSHIVRLVPLTESEHDQTTRGCAVHLLGLIANDEADKHIRKLMRDPDAHVSKEAAFALLRRNDDDAVQRVLEMWNEETMTDENRNEIILAFPTERAGNHLNLYEEVLCNSNIDDVARSHALNLLGMLGDTATATKIAACLENEKNPQLRDMMASARAAILARKKQPDNTTPGK